MENKYSHTGFDEKNYPDGIDNPLQVINAIDNFWDKEIQGEEMTYEKWKTLREYLCKNIVY